MHITYPIPNEIYVSILDDKGSAEFPPAILSFRLPCSAAENVIIKIEIYSSLNCN